MSKDIKAEFLADVAKHKATILRNDGLYRHIEFRGEHGRHHWFEIVTWPNGLIIRGDMGTWAFSRIEDMFEFFRGGGISPHYWAEKLQHGTSSAIESAKQFTIDTLRRQVFEHLENWELKEAQVEEVKAELESEVLCFSDLEEHEALDALFNFDCGYGVTFDPTDGPFGRDWQYHYLWCCWAIVWGIQQWDAITGAGKSA